jgi:hypothetical protein
MNADDELGWEVMRAGLAEATRVLGAQVVAAYALGSLAHGGFSRRASDVDLAVVLDALPPDIDDVMDRVKRAVAVQLGTPLAGRLSMFWSTWDSLASRDVQGRFPLVDRIDLQAQGVLLAGVDQRARVALPDGAQRRAILLAQGAELALHKLTTPEHEALVRDPSRLVALGCREVTKAVLFPVRFLTTVDTGEPADNVTAVEHYTQQRKGAASRLVAAAGRYRAQGLDDDAEPLLRAEMALLEREFVDSYAVALREVGRADLADAFAAWRARLA